MTPEANNIIVFNNGNSVGLTTVMPNGGQDIPKSIEGLSDEWKKAQNRDTNISISLITNNKKPWFNPFFTNIVWSPKYVLSAITSLNHKLIDNNRVNKHKNNTLNDAIYPCEVNANVRAKFINENDVVIGQGDGSTKWNGCNCTKPLMLFFIIFKIYNDYDH